MSMTRRGHRPPKGKPHVARADLPLTSTQGMVLEYLISHVCKYGFQPSLGMIATHFGWNGPSAADSHVAVLKMKHYVVGGKGMRSLRIVRDPGGREILGFSVVYKGTPP